MLVHLYQSLFSPKDLVYIQKMQHSLLNITACRRVRFHKINSVLVTFVVCVLYTLQIKNMCLMVTAKHKNWTLQWLLLGPFRDPPRWISQSEPALVRLWGQHYYRMVGQRVRSLVHIDSSKKICSWLWNRNGPIRLLCTGLLPEPVLSLLLLCWPSPVTWPTQAFHSITRW